MSEAYCCLSLVTTFLLTWACLLFSKAHFLNENNIIHFAKSVRIRSFSGPYSPTVGLNTEKYSVSLRTHSEWVKIWTSKTPNTNTFHTFYQYPSSYSELNYCPWVFLLCKFGDHSSCWHHCTRKTKFSIKVFFIKCDQIRIFLWIWSHLLKKFLMENFIFCAVHGILVSCRCHAILQWWHLTLTGAS